jgi:DNA-binding CsgD family transcriptional regulator
MRRAKSVILRRYRADIVALLRRGELTYAEIGERFDVSRSSIGYIARDVNLCRPKGGRRVAAAKPGR